MKRMSRVDRAVSYANSGLKSPEYSDPKTRVKEKAGSVPFHTMARIERKR